MRTHGRDRRPKNCGGFAAARGRGSRLRVGSMRIRGGGYLVSRTGSRVGFRVWGRTTFEGMALPARDPGREFTMIAEAKSAAAVLVNGSNHEQGRLGGGRQTRPSEEILQAGNERHALSSLERSPAKAILGVEQSPGRKVIPGKAKIRGGALGDFNAQQITKPRIHSPHGPRRSPLPGKAQLS